MRVKGKLQSSLIQGRTSTQKIISTLSSVTITGSTQTYSSKVEAITAVSVFKARSLVSTIVSKIVTGSARVDIEAAMKASLIAGDSCKYFIIYSSHCKHLLFHIRRRHFWSLNLTNVKVNIIFF